MPSVENDARSRPERLLNLVIMLLVQDKFVSKETIRTTLYGEPAGAAFDRMFDRDKELLRDLGVPIETGYQDAWFEDEPGYRIRPDDYALPGIRFSADEAAVVSLAAKVWQHAALADATRSALRKLAPVMEEAEEPATVSLPALEGAVLVAEEPTFEAFWTATQERRRVRFGYRPAGSLETSQRHVEPWGVVRQAGRWYVVGRDVDRDAERVFRLSRVVGPARPGKEADAFDVPADVDLKAAMKRLSPPPEPVLAELLVRPDRGWGLRRQGELLETGVEGPDGTGDWDLVRVSGSLGPLAEQVLSLGDSVVVRSPDALRGLVIKRLRAFVEQATSHESAGGAA